MLKQFGFVPYFLQLSESKFYDIKRHFVVESKVERKGGEHEGGSTETPAPLSDALVAESFLLFLYGIAMATIALIGEVITKLCVKAEETNWHTLSDSLFLLENCLSK